MTTAPGAQGDGTQPSGGSQQPGGLPDRHAGQGSEWSDTSPPVRIVLASGSPRRRELLERLGLVFEVRAADVDETPQPGEDPRAHVRRLAIAKCDAVASGVDDATLVIAADTVVDTLDDTMVDTLDDTVVDTLDDTIDDTMVDTAGRIAGKPVDAADARRTLRNLSGRAHQVHTGVAVRRGTATAVEVVTTVVHMVSMTDATIEWYLSTGEPFDKAGSYAVQGAGAVLVESVEGDVTNVIGLPLPTLARLATSVGVALLPRRGRAPCW